MFLTKPIIVESLSSNVYVLEWVLAQVNQRIRFICSISNIGLFEPWQNETFK